MSGQVKDTNQTFAARLRELMWEQRIGVVRLSTISHVDQRLLRKYRAGTTEPRDAFGWPTANAMKLARALGVELDELITPLEKDAA